MTFKNGLLFAFFIWGSLLNAQSTDDCNVYFRGTDPQLDVDRLDLVQEQLFAHTHKKLKPNLKEKDMVVCNANLTQLGEETYIRLEIEVASRNAKGTYGHIPKANVLTIHFINGEKIYLNSPADSRGKFDPDTEKTIYNVFYFIKIPKVLKKKEVDKIGIFWTTGYEEYTIYNIDFFMRQLECLQKVL